MTLTTAQRVRLRVSDFPLMADLTHYGDGTAQTFALPHRNLVSASAFVPNGASWTATGATFNPSGSVAFSGVISGASAFRTTYVYSVFTDEEIDDFLTVGGGVNGAALEAVTTLMFDGLKRSRWSAPDGTSHDDTAAIGLLREMYNTLKEEQAEEAVAGGGFGEWGMNQGNYT